MTAYLNTNDRTVSATTNDSLQAGGRSPLLLGLYMGIVKNTADVQKNGRMMVWIPEFASSPENEKGWTTVSYCSPFAGSTNVATIDKNNTQQFEGTQTTYGMWMVPPDLGNIVLVMFINGNPGKGVWIGSLFNQFVNNSIPGTASSANNYQYPGKNIPVAEYNKSIGNTTDADTVKKPYHATKFNGVGNQGLINDPVRGSTNSSARRESPSEVFGISTPGPVIKGSKNKSDIRRKGGSSFVMDDAENSEYVQLSTKSGAQIHINESNGFIYMINRDGTSWVQMDKDGNVDIFGAKNISMRAQRDFNIRADRNINIEAGQNIFMKAAKDTKEKTTTFTYDVNNAPVTKNIPEWGYVGEGKGDGGNIVLQTLNNLQSTSQKGVFLTAVENDINVKIGNSLSVTTQNGGQDFNSKKGIKLTTDAAVDVSATGNIRVGSKGTISVVGMGDVVFCTNSNMSLNAMSNIIETAAGSMSLDASSLNIGTNTLIGGSLGVTGIISSSQTANLKSTWANIAGGLGATSDGSADGPAVETPLVAEGAMSAGTARPAEVKPLNNKLNILATWSDPTDTNWTYFSTSVSYKVDDVVKYEADGLFYKSKVTQPKGAFNPSNWTTVTPTPLSKFKRNSAPIQTIVSGFPTYEPCPEHENFNKGNVAGGAPVITPDDATYMGSAGVGNTHAQMSMTGYGYSPPAPPPAAVNPGSSNKSVTGDSLADSNIASNILTSALRKQLVIHEGLKDKSYTDTVGLITGGIGHLMRVNEIPLYPVGTPIETDQIENWYSADSSSATKIAQKLVGDTWDELSDIRKRGIIDLAYNLGMGGLSKFVKFLAAIKAKDFARADIELSTSKWYRQVGKRGPNICAMIGNNIDPTNKTKVG
jgi:lysozyme